ncbi:MAG TPA: hypothetical protein VFX98_09650 [Longimicrobiaceae bacterium]|nr:hypothetical protein [Longimicrobiaceae bacterium]
MQALARKMARGLCAAALLGVMGFTPAQPAVTTVELCKGAPCNSMTCGTACFKKGYTHWACWNGNCQCSHGPQP